MSGQVDVVMDGVMRLSGRELDAAVAERVMGRTVVRVDPATGSTGYWVARDGVREVCDGHTRPMLAEVPHYSSDIAAAWEVVLELPWPIVLNNIVEGEWGCWVLYYGGDKTHDSDVIVYAPTAPEAICRAALLAALKRAEAKTGGGEA